MASLLPFLMFEGAANDAIALYLSVVPDSAVEAMDCYGPEGPGPDGTVRLARVRLASQAVLFSDSPIPHHFHFTPSTSLYVTCDSESQQSELAGTLATDGKWLMPLDDYGFSQRFGWLEDRFGVSWQINLPFEPNRGVPPGA